MIKLLFRRWIEAEAAELSQQRAREANGDMINQIIETSKHGLAISSPSRVFSDLGKEGREDA